MRRLRVLHLRASNFVGGPEQQLLRYAEAERDGAYEVLIGSFVGPGEGTGLLQAARDRGIATVSLPSRNIGLNSALSALIREMALRKIDVLCTHGFKADILGVLSGPLSGVPVACFLRGWTRENRKVRIYEALDRKLLCFADRIVCLSETQASKLTEAGATRNKIRIVGNAIDVPEIDARTRSSCRGELHRRYDLPEDCLTVATAGRLSPEKGTADFVQAASSVTRQFPDLRFLIFGDGPLRQRLEDQARNLGLQDHVKFIGFEPDLRGLLPGIDLLVNPSHSEEMPNIVLEGMAAGIPVVATAVGAVEEIAGPEHAICLAPAAMPEILAEKMRLLLREPERAKALAEMGRSRVCNAYSLEHQRAQFRDLYQELAPFGRLASTSIDKDLARDNRTSGDAAPGDSAGATPFVSVVMPVRNEKANIGAVLAQLEAQDYPRDRFEVLVADGNSTDGTAEAVEDFARRSSASIRVLRNPAQLSSAGRNVGARESRGEYVVFVDGHCYIPGQTLLRDVVALFQESGADCLCRPQPLTMPGESPFQEIVAHVRATTLGHGRDSTIYATNLEGFINPSSSGAIYRRSVFALAGYYDERFDACEDVEFNHRVFEAGLKSYISPRLTVLYKPRNSLRSLWQQMIRYGRGRFRLIRKHRSARSISQFLPAGLIIWLAVCGVGGLFSKPVAGIFFGTGAIYLAGVLGFSAALGLRYGWRHALQAPSVYFAIHFGLGVGFLMECFGARKRSVRPPVDSRASSEPGVLVPAIPVNGTAGVVASSTRGESRVIRAWAGHPDVASRAVGDFVNSITVDVEDYFHTEAMTSAVKQEQWSQLASRVETNTRRLFDLFARLEVRGTFFFLGWVAERFPQLVQEAAHLGHEIGCHSYWHRLVYRLTPDEFKEDTRRAKEAIEDAAGMQIYGYRAPSFSLVRGTEWAAEILADLGFTYDSSVCPIEHDLYANPGAPRTPSRIAGGKMMEFPVATLAFRNHNIPVGGGGYLRILPYAYTRWGLSRLNRTDKMRAVVYTHPWEIDPGQPRLDAAGRARFRQYTGLASTATKLERLLRDFRFAPIRDCYSAELAGVLRADHSNLDSGSLRAQPA